MNHLPFIIFFFAIGACIGSFLNVVVWRLPRDESLITPPSHCPNCNHLLKWFDNLPIIGWIKLGGKCRYCRQPISPRYPIVEAITACLFVLYYLAFFVWQWRTCCPQPRTGQLTFNELGEPYTIYSAHWWLADSWPMYVLFMALISALLAASLIDAELYIIPVKIPWTIAIVGFAVHAFADRPWLPGSLNLVGPYGKLGAALAAGGGIGLALSILLWHLHILPTSFPQGEPLLDVDHAMIEEERQRLEKAGETSEPLELPPKYTSHEIRREISKEALFLLLPVMLGTLCLCLVAMVPSIGKIWEQWLQYNWFSGLLGSLLGAMVGAVVVWFFRIGGTYVFGRVAMGLGDVHLMFGVGAVIGAAGATVAFFLAPFFSIVIAIYMLIARKGREIPLGPYLSAATACVMLCYCPIVDYLTPGVKGLLLIVGGWFGWSAA